MRMTIAPLLLAAAALSLGAHDASAKTRHRHAAPLYSSDYQQLPLTVNKRSFLDPGPVAPVGTGTNYVAANTIYNQTPDRVSEPAKFGNSVFPGQPYVPGRSVPVAEFATGPNAGDLYAGPLFGIDR